MKEVPSSGYRECPMCGENILATAKKCRFCNEIVDVALKTAIEARELATRAGDSPIVQQQVVVHTDPKRQNSCAAAGCILVVGVFTWMWLAGACKPVTTPKPPKRANDHAQPRGPETSPQPGSRWRGTWLADSQTWTFDMELTLNSGTINGTIRWSRPDVAEQQGIERVSGEYEPVTREYRLTGYEREGNVGLYEYRLKVSSDGQSLSGVSRPVGGEWGGEVQARRQKRTVM